MDDVGWTGVFEIYREKSHSRHNGDPSSVDHEIQRTGEKQTFPHTKEKRNWIGSEYYFWDPPFFPSTLEIGLYLAVLYLLSTGTSTVRFTRITSF